MAKIRFVVLILSQSQEQKYIHIWQCCYSNRLKQLCVLYLFQHLHIPPRTLFFFSPASSELDEAITDERKRKEKIKKENVYLKIVRPESDRENMDWLKLTFSIWLANWTELTNHIAKIDLSQSMCSLSDLSLKETHRWHQWMYLIRCFSRPILTSMLCSAWKLEQIFLIIWPLKKIRWKQDA